MKHIAKSIQKTYVNCAGHIPTGTSTVVHRLFGTKLPSETIRKIEKEEGKKLPEVFDSHGLCVPCAGTRYGQRIADRLTDDYVRDNPDVRLIVTYSHEELFNALANLYEQESLCESRRDVQGAKQVQASINEILHLIDSQGRLVVTLPPG